MTAAENSVYKEDHACFRGTGRIVTRYDPSGDCREFLRLDGRQYG